MAIRENPKQDMAAISLAAMSCFAQRRTLLLDETRSFDAIQAVRADAYRERYLMRISLIYNPTAGSAERIREFLGCLTSRHRCELRPTSGPEDARQFARDAVHDGFDRIVVAGGDGTINQVVNGLAPDFGAIELAILPLGTGNDLARVLGLMAHPFPVICTAAIGTQVTPVDIVRMSNGPHVSYCVNVANGGLGGQVSENVRVEDKQRWGPLAYWMQSISRVTELRSFGVRLVLDDCCFDTNVSGIAVANGRYVGGGFPIAPRAMINDGVLDVTVIPALPMFELMAAGLNFVLGRDEREERVEYYRARHIEVRSEPELPFSIDGESFSAFDAVFEVVPSALRMVVNEDVPGLIAAPQHGPFVG